MKKRAGSYLTGLGNKLKKIDKSLKNMHIPPRFLFIVMGISSTVWFLIRVIPKPSRAYYPCMRAAAPLMSGFIIYLLSVGGLSLTLRKAYRNLRSSRYIPATVWIILRTELECALYSVRRWFRYHVYPDCRFQGQ